MRIRYIFSFPYSVDQGGGNQIIKDITTKLTARLGDVQILNYEATEIDFDILIVFGCTYINIDMLQMYRNAGVKIIIYPIFDRMQPVWKMKLFAPLKKLPILNIYSLRCKLFELADKIIVANTSEHRDIKEIYSVDDSKILTLLYRLSDSFFETADTVSPNLFWEKYGIKDFVFCPAARVSKRKNQVNLIHAMANTGISVVINNTQNIDSDIKDIFWKLAKSIPNIVCLEGFDREMLISCYKNARVSVSASHAETAGLVNLEAGYLGCNLAVSNLEALHEYLGEYASFFDQNNPESIKKAILYQYSLPKSQQLPGYIRDKFTWNSYLDSLVAVMNTELTTSVAK
jgi:glycosyltransferase involved in cell wall biosynthesis